MLNDGRATTKRTRVTLFTDRGLQQFILEDGQDLQFTDAVLRDKVSQALLAIQANCAKDARTLELSARGTGKRTLRVAYIVEAPVWEASYRFTLAAEAPRSALQGWATVENLSGQDWKDVELMLVSGRPVAFSRALYNAYYVTRPEVPVEVAGRLMPGIDRVLPRPAGARRGPRLCPATARRGSGRAGRGDRCRHPGRLQVPARCQRHQRPHALDPDRPPPGAGVAAGALPGRFDRPQSAGGGAPHQ